ncbi:dehydrogenase [Endozoicomonas sp. SM1973]|uniref:Dehydrogenase n=1 Tax=Spartinivicinus marinus TaxID=2994442 RepID=A0A853ICQ0_9GAMM|nr:PA2817 family protein [Spartinivicinus marinus]MCX4025009.1 hypothetical protein [Spartinivicinus marinus]NYZ67701.1 dehydrogenase [Spartinivicinus marinus]
MSTTPSLEALFNQLANGIKQASSEVNQETLTNWINRCQELAECFKQGDEAAYQQGQDTVCQLINYWPQLTHLISRDLLWLLGGECLHFMPEEEIAVYQQLEELQASAEAANQSFDWQETKQLLNTQKTNSQVTTNKQFH